MPDKEMFKSALLLFILLSTALAAAAQVGPTAPALDSDVPEGLTHCVAESLNFSGDLNVIDGVSIFNVPADQGLIRIRVTCEDADGNTVQGHSGLQVPVAGGETVFDDLTFDSEIPTPKRLAVTPAPLQLVGTGVTEQLTVEATLPDDTVVDVTAEEATAYDSSNSAVASVDGDGLVTAQGSGAAVLTVMNEGRIGLAFVTVTSAALTGLEASPSEISFAPHALFSAPGLALGIRGLLADASDTDLTAAAQGTTYASSNPAVAQVSADGLVVSIGEGLANVTVSNGGFEIDVPVEVTALFTPAPTAAFNTSGGFAHNVDIRGALVYVADDLNGLVVYDFETGFLGKLAFASGRAFDVKVRGTLAVVGLDLGIALVDVSNPARPVEIARIADSGSVRDLWLSGDRVYAAAADQFKVYDISDPQAPALVGSRSFAKPVLAVAGDSTRNIAVALTANPGSTTPTLEVIRLAPAQPWPTAPLDLPTAVADDVTLLGTDVYVANGSAGLHAVDISNPDRPRLMKSSASNLINALGVAVRDTSRGRLLVAADWVFVNAVPFFNRNLVNVLNLDFSGFDGVIQGDANSYGAALGEGFGAVAVGGAGIQVFSTDFLSDNLGRPPTVTLQAPTEGQVLVANREHEIRALAIDDIAVDRVEFLVNGRVVGTDETPPYATTHLLPEGTFEIRARAVDKGGSIGISNCVLVSAEVPAGPPIIPGAVASDLKIGKIDQDAGGFGEALDPVDFFGFAVATLGDLDANTDPEPHALAVGARLDDDGGNAVGAVWILFLDAAGTVVREQKISAAPGGAMEGELAETDQFGWAVASLGDLDGDGVGDLAVGAPEDSVVFGEGAVWILFLNPDGTVREKRKINAGQGFEGRLDIADYFGVALASLGVLEILDNDTPADPADDVPLHGLAVGALLDDDGVRNAGAVWILLLNTDGTVHHVHKISATEGSFDGVLETGDGFGSSLASLGDLDGDGTVDLVVGASRDDDGGFDRGAAWILFLEIADGIDVENSIDVKGFVKISDLEGDFDGRLDDGDFFGSSVSLLGDLDGDGVDDLGVGSTGDDDLGSDRGAMWILFLNANGTVKGLQKISAASPSFLDRLADGDRFGTSAASLGDLDGDGVPDLAVGAPEDLYEDYGAVWILFLDGIVP